MKKTVFSIILMIMAAVFSEVSAWAATGDVIGSIYSTDIMASINGVWVESYNIGGKTVVIIEDITSQYAYSDASRTLAIWDLAPQELNTGGKISNKRPGTRIGRIYETDIKTIFRGKEIKSYSLNGKMAVEIEDLGCDNEFSNIGGKYIWNEKERTISLEVIHRYTSEIHDILRDKGVNMVINQKDGKLVAEFVPVAITNGSILGGGTVSDNSMSEVLYNGEVIGYKCKFPNMELTFDGFLRPDGFWTDVDYYYADKIKAAISDISPILPTAEDWVTYYEQNMYVIKERFETDEYMFLYMTLATPHGGSQWLMKFDKTTCETISYNGEFNSVSLYGAKIFEHVKVDEKSEKVYLHYDYDYVIDLKTDEVKAYNNLTTDIGIGTSAGKPSEYDKDLVLNSKKEYRLISGDVAKTVNGFTANEYYYATMLPLKETFDFLNIKYSFEDNVLTIDTSEAKPFSFEMTDNAAKNTSENIDYLLVDKVIIDGEESEITYQYTSGHFENTHQGQAKAMPYVSGGTVYINNSFISKLLNETEK